MFRNIDQILRRFSSYPWYEVAVEIVVIAACMYLALRFLRGTRGAGVVKGVAFILIILTLGIRVLGGVTDAFTRLNFLYGKFMGLVSIMLIVVFQPELRRALMRLGEAPLLRRSHRAVQPVVEAVAEAAIFLSKSQFGALIAIARRGTLAPLAETGVALNADVSSHLLQSIFWPNNPLHDLGVVIQGGRILAAGVQFPMIEEGAVPPDLGSRHRAGLGLSAEMDCIVVIVSEETGRISIAEGGRLERDIPRDSLRDVLLRRLHATADAAHDLPHTSEDGIAERPASEAGNKVTRRSEAA